jgi:molecular chaperone GrpE
VSRRKRGWKSSADDPGAASAGEGAPEEAGGSVEPGPELGEALREASEAQAGAGEAEPDAEGQLAELQDAHLRLQAEFENFRRRGQKEREEALKFGPQNLIKDLLPTVDNLERAIDHAKGSGDSNLEGILQGVELVLGELKGVLGKHGISVIEAENGPFDPVVHEAVGQVLDASQPPNTVVEVLEKGYQLHDRMLRPARVIVSKAPGEDDDPAAGGRT